MSMDGLSAVHTGPRSSTTRLRQLPPTDGPDRTEIAGARERIAIPGRGAVGVRLVGRSGPPVVLLHGWGATADINFGLLYPQLSHRWQIVAPDHRGHGGGIRSDAPFSPPAPADDLAAPLRPPPPGPAPGLGYSIGGPLGSRPAPPPPRPVSGPVLRATAPHRPP